MLFTLKTINYLHKQICQFYYLRFILKYHLKTLYHFDLINYSIYFYLLVFMVNKKKRN